MLENQRCQQNQQIVLNQNVYQISLNQTQEDQVHLNVNLNNNLWNRIKTPLRNQWNSQRRYQVSNQSHLLKDQFKDKNQMSDHHQRKKGKEDQRTYMQLQATMDRNLLKDKLVATYLHQNLKVIRTELYKKLRKWTNLMKMNKSFWIWLIHLNSLFLRFKEIKVDSNLWLKIFKVSLKWSKTNRFPNKLLKILAYSLRVSKIKTLKVQLKY